MYWVSSEGGPLLFLSEKHISKWQGVAGGRAEESDYV